MGYISCKGSLWSINNLLEANVAMDLVHGQSKSLSKNKNKEMKNKIFGHLSEPCGLPPLFSGRNSLSHHLWQIPNLRVGELERVRLREEGIETGRERGGDIL